MYINNVFWIFRIIVRTD